MGAEYPSQDLRSKLCAMLKNTVVKKSRICEGNGLFAKLDMKSRTIVVSGGVITNKQSQWTVALTKQVWVDGLPTELKDFTQLGYINEDIWRADGHNKAPSIT